MPIRKFAGLETEYSLHVSHADGPISDVVDSRTHEQQVEAIVRTAGRVGSGWSHDFDRAQVWLPNGGLLYVDFGDHPEYATPESSDPLELIRQHKLGDLVMASASERANRTDRRFVRRLFKNNVDSAGHTFGTHESYCIDAKLRIPDLVEQLGSFLASRIVFAGAGSIVTDQRGHAYYEVSARARHILQLDSIDTTHVRPLINLRDESHADDTRFKRLHLICGDANRCDVANYLKIGTTAIVLGMLEDGVSIDHLTFEDPLEALHRTSANPDHWPMLRLIHGAAMNALEHQQAIAELADAYVAKRGSALFAQPGTARDIVDRWKTVLNLLAVDRRATIGMLDWTTKANLLESAAHRHSLSLGDPAMLQYDLRWGEITRDNVFSKLERASKVDVLVPTETDLTKLTAPRDSRAALRGLLIQRFKGSLADIRWNTVVLSAHGESRRLSIEMDDPASFSATTLEAIGGLEASEADLRVRLVLEVMREADGFRNRTLAYETASAYLACAADAVPLQQRYIGYAVANGVARTLANILYSKLAFGHIALVRDGLELIRRAAALTDDPSRVCDVLHAAHESAEVRRQAHLADDREQRSRRIQHAWVTETIATLRDPGHRPPPHPSTPEFGGR